MNKSLSVSGGGRVIEAKDTNRCACSSSEEAISNDQGSTIFDLYLMFQY